MDAVLEVKLFSSKRDKGFYRGRIIIFIRNGMVFVCEKIFSKALLSNVSALERIVQHHKREVKFLAIANDFKNDFKYYTRLRYREVERFMYGKVGIYSIRRGLKFLLWNKISSSLKNFHRLYWKIKLSSITRDEDII